MFSPFSTSTTSTRTLTCCCLLVMVLGVVSQEGGGSSLDEQSRKPLYKYRYETEDLMKTAASSVPVHGYHLVEGGYYHQQQPRFANFENSPRFGMGMTMGFQPQGQFLPTMPMNTAEFRPQGFIPMGMVQVHQPHLHGGGGEFQDHTTYQDGKQQLNDLTYKNIASDEEQSGKQDQEGFQRGGAQIRNDKSDSASYTGEQGQKKASEDGKNYHGAQHYNQQGKNADEANQKQGHKKGHVIKGFKTSHHKDETGRTEEYYDESNDEAGNANFKGSSGAFGQQAQNSYKGGHENGVFNADQSKKQGHFENVHVQDNANADKGDYANRKSYGQAHSHGVNNGVDQQSLLGHQESSRLFKHHPYHVPFYKGY